tara:strand:- start:1101 stop:1343 length:243 start_codon:yes stop_codon:yes gene_type:complete
MAQDEIPAFEKPDELSRTGTMSLLRSYALGVIQKKTRDAIKESQGDVSEGALPETPTLPAQGKTPLSPFKDPEEYQEEEI